MCSECLIYQYNILQGIGENGNSIFIITSVPQMNADASEGFPSRNCKKNDLTLTTSLSIQRRNEGEDIAKVYR